MSTGTDWRVHHSISLPEMACDFYEVTDDKGGETYIRVPVHSGDVLLGEERLGRYREGVAQVLKQGGDVIVRLSSNSFPLLQAADLSILPLLPALAECPSILGVSGRSVSSPSKTLWNARLCAVLKSPAVAERAKQKLLRDAARKGKAVKPQTLEAAEYLFVLPTLPEEKAYGARRGGAGQVLHLYRARYGSSYVSSGSEVATASGARPQTSRRVGACRHPRQAADGAFDRAAPASGPLLFPPGDSTSQRRRRWREFIEAHAMRSSRS